VLAIVLICALCIQRTGLALDARPEVGRITVHRFGALIDDGVVKVIMTEPGGLGLSVSLVS
jgi:peroxiredoxin